MVPWLCLQFVIVVLRNHTHLLCLSSVFLWGWMSAGDLSIQFGVGMKKLCLRLQKIHINLTAK